MTRSVIPSAVAREVFAFAAIEVALMSRPLAEVVRLLSQEERATVRPAPERVVNELPVYGSKHDGRHLALVTIAELVRRDIKAATGTGLLPARLRATKNPIHSPSGVRVIKTIEAIACAYKRPRTSPPSSWDFLVHVEFDPELAKKLRAEIVSAVMNASRAA